MTSFGKMLTILDLFEAGASGLTAEQIITRLSCSRPQGYRYIRELSEAGFLMRFRGGYALGPRCIQLDYIIRQSDPLLAASVSVMRDVSARNGCDVLLASMYQDRVVAVHHERGPDPMTVSFGRGRLMPLFRGAGSKVILAALPSARQAQLYEQHAEDGASSPLGTSWEEVKANLKVVRRAGYAVSVGELDPVNVGIAVPLMVEGMTAPASIVLVLSANRYRTTNVEAVVQVALSAQQSIVYALTHNGADRPPESLEDTQPLLGVVTA